MESQRDSFSECQPVRQAGRQAVRLHFWEGPNGHALSATPKNIDIPARDLQSHVSTLRHVLIDF